jgi:hypothetical protein
VTYSEAIAVKRGQLLTQYGFERRWQRWERPVRIVDARPRRNGDHYLGWVHADTTVWTVRWISQRNFDRYYTPVGDQEGDQP